jgi:UDP-glucose 4-epimerase
VILIECHPVDNGVKICNVGSGKAPFLNQLFRLIEEMTGKLIIREYKENTDVDVKSIILDCSRKKESYNW